jgi:hypothetical protein
LINKEVCANKRILNYTNKMSELDKSSIEIKNQNFLETLRRGQVNAEVIIEKAPFTPIDKVEKFLDDQPEIDDNSARAILLFCCLPEAAKLVENSQSLSGQGHAKVKDVDYDKVIRFNRALKEMIVDADGTNLEPQILIYEIKKFAKENALIDIQHIKDFVEQIASTTRGMWNEQLAENILCAADIGNYSTLIEQDRKGIDFFIATGDEKENWVGVDVKSSATGMMRNMQEDLSFEDSELIYITAGQPPQILERGQKRPYASQEEPVIYVACSPERALISIDVGQRGIPETLATPRYGKDDKTVITLARQMQEYLANSSCKTYAHGKHGFYSLDKAYKVGRFATNPQ